MITEGDTEMNAGWGRVLIGVGVIIAFLALGALEVLTARLPAGVTGGGAGQFRRRVGGDRADFSTCGGT